MNDENLKPIKKGDLTKEQTKERGRNGGLKSVEVRRSKKTFAQIFQAWADAETEDKNKYQLKQLGITDEKVTNKMMILVPLLKNITKGDIRSIQMALELLEEDKTKEKELQKLQAEIDKLKLEKQRLQKEIDGEIETSKILIVNDIPKEF